MCTNKNLASIHKRNVMGLVDSHIMLHKNRMSDVNTFLEMYTHAYTDICASRVGPSRMTIISGHWVHGAWRLSFAPYSYACPSCLSKPSLF